MVRIKLKELDGAFMLNEFINAKIKTYIDNVNKRYILNIDNHYYYAKYGDILLLYVNRINNNTLKEINRIDILKYINIQELKTCIVNKKLTHNLKHAIDKTNVNINYKIDAFNNVPMFYIETYSSDLITFDIMNILNDTTIIKECKLCGDLFIKRYKRLYCDKCINSPDKTKVLNKANHLRIKEAYTPDWVRLLARKRIVKRIKNDNVKYINDYYVNILNLFKSNIKDYNNCLVINSLDYIVFNAMPLYYEIVLTNNRGKFIPLENLYKDLNKACSDLDSFKAYIDNTILKSLDKYAINTFVSKLNKNVIHKSSIPQTFKDHIVITLNSFTSINKRFKFVDKSIIVE